MKQNWKSFPSSAPDLCSTTQNPFLVHGVVSTLILPSLKAQNLFLPLKSRAKLLLVQWENKDHDSPHAHTLGLFAILAVQKHCSEDRLFRFFEVKSFQESSLMNYITEEIV